MDANDAVGSGAVSDACCDIEHPIIDPIDAPLPDDVDAEGPRDVCVGLSKDTELMKLELNLGEGTSRTTGCAGGRLALLLFVGPAVGVAPKAGLALVVGGVGGVQATLASTRISSLGLCTGAGACAVAEDVDDDGDAFDATDESTKSARRPGELVEAALLFADVGDKNSMPE
jgi:hypothetical protein